MISRLVEKAFYYLEVPVTRVTGFDVVIPFFSREQVYLPGATRIVRAARKMLST